MLSLLLNNLFAIAQTLLSQYELLSENIFSFLGLSQLFPEHAIAGQLLIEIIYLILIPLLCCNLLDLPEDKHQAGSIAEKGKLLSGLSFLHLIDILERLGEFIGLIQGIVIAINLLEIGIRALRFHRSDVLRVLIVGS